MHLHKNLTAPDSNCTRSVSSNVLTQVESSDFWNYIREPIMRDISQLIPNAWPLLFISYKNCKLGEIISPFDIISNLAENYFNVPLYEINLFKTTDIGDLLGSFEQTNLDNMIEKSLIHLKNLLQNYFDMSNNENIQEKQTICKMILSFEYLVKNNKGLKEKSKVLGSIIENLTMFDFVNRNSESIKDEFDTNNLDSIAKKISEIIVSLKKIN